MRKAAAISVIALVLVAAALLRPSPPPDAILLESVQSPPRVLPESVQSRLRVLPESVQSRTGSQSGRIRVGTGSDPGRNRVGTGSDPSDGGRTSELQELPASTLNATFDAPGISPVTPGHSADGAVSRAFHTAAAQTAGAFRTAGLALRSVF
jgi:hypothetical protein